MNKSILIADSGGTQTDWCFIDLNGEKHFFTTKSFHPTNWNDVFFEEFFQFWQGKEELKNASVHFYGAGCLNESNKQRLLKSFLNWGFKQVSILSDIEGACHALLGKTKGTVAILGTGSVLCNYDGENSFEIKGGLGYLLGDEGSGYYFGKLLVSAFLNNEFDETTMKELSLLLGGRNEVLGKVYGENGKAFLSSMPLITKELNITDSPIYKLHEENFILFINKYSTGSFNDIKEISIIGSYGFHNRNLLLQILQKNNIKLVNIIQYPIIALTDYILKHTNESTNGSF